MENIKFIKNFKKIAQDAWLKGWHERNGGNYSYRLTPQEIQEIQEIQPYIKDDKEWIPIGTEIDNLKNEYFLVTGSGKYLRNVEEDLCDSCGLIELDNTGRNYRIVWGLCNDGKPTSELPSHLMSHCVKKKISEEYRMIMHAHPANVIALTFVLPLEEKVFTRQLWEMATECPIVFPDGIGVIGWRVPGSVAIGEETCEQMKYHDVVIWAHHGIFCAGKTLDETFGLMDTVEKSAEILVKVLSMGGKKQTITSDNFKELAPAFHTVLADKYVD